MTSALSFATLRASLQDYDEALRHKSAALPALDTWFRTELRRAVEMRAGKHEDNVAAAAAGSSSGSEGLGKSAKSKKAKKLPFDETLDVAFVTRDELAKLMKWKLTRGKFRPRLEQLILSNSEQEVKRVTKEAFARLVQSEVGKKKTRDIDWPAIDDAKSALLLLNGLKGVGPATSSALLALVAPHSLPFMSDEALLHGAGLRDKPKYNVAEWTWYVGRMRERVREWETAATEADEKQQRKSMTVDELERSAWAYAILAKTKASEQGKADHLRNDEEAGRGMASTKRRRRK